MTNWTKYISDLDAFELYHQAQEHQELSSTTAAFLAFLPALRQALAGSAGTAISNVVVYPLDLVVTRLKVQRRLKGRTTSASHSDHDTQYKGIADAITKIYTYEGGIPAFYSGVTEGTVKSMADAFFFFLAYNVLQRTRRKWPAAKHPMLQVLDSLGLGMTAGAFSRLLTTPIQIVVTRKQIAAVASASKAKDHKPYTLGRELSVRQIVDGVYNEQGVLGFWSGYSASLLLTMNPAITFFLDSFLRRALKISKEPSVITTFLLAAIGKSTASAMLYPLSLAKSRAQASSASSKEVEDGQEKTANRTKKNTRTPNILSTIGDIIRTEGIASLYAGLSGEVMKGFFAHGLTMLLKDRLYSVVVRLYYALARLQHRLKTRKF